MNDDRISKLQAQIKHPLLVKKKENLLYLTGRSFISGCLLVRPLPNPPLMRGGNRGEVVFLGDGLEKVEGMRYAKISEIGKYLRGIRQLDLEDNFTFAEAGLIGKRLNSSAIPTAADRDDKNHIFLKPIKSPVDQMRVVKDPKEIALIVKSMEIVEKVFSQVKKRLRGGKKDTEKQLANFIREAGLKLGAEEVSFDPIVAAGANASIPHHIPTSRRLKAGESIIIDFGFKYRGYCSDFTRTVFLKSAPKKLAEAYKQVEKAYNASLDFIDGNLQGFPLKIPIEAEVVYQKSVKVLAEKKLDKYFIHSLGHGTGLEIHEAPWLSALSTDQLRPGMVFSIEPGVYFPKLGGIRIEDLVYLHSNRLHKFITVPTSLQQNIIRS